MRNINRLKWTAAITILAGAMAQANASLVLDGDFESGTLSPWTGFNSTITSDPANVFDGQNAAQLSPLASQLAQSVDILADQSYELQFWAKASGAGTLTIGLDGSPTLSVIFPTTLTSAYQEYTGYFTPYSSGNLWFSWSGGGTGSAFIDDVSLIPVSSGSSPAYLYAPIPEPSTFLAGACLLFPLGLLMFRGLRQTPRVSAIAQGDRSR